ncbi:unnamed protein product [Rhizoctonia solani]|uniref:Uncharacterized protein n=1 Tax=Rhizoctonia solani TaxID=456999 RepID=A0A8H3HHF3_9AGAM|nr:unnamed protein product [Rhizoctonia solani]
MQLFNRFLSLRRRGHSNKKNKSRQSSGSSFEYGQPSVDRLSGDFDPYQYRFQAADRSDFDLTRSAGIPIRVTTPRSFPLPQHPIDHVPRRDQNELASPRSVKVHRKKLLQRTEFPHAYPPRSPRKVSQAEFSRSDPGLKGRNRSVRRIESVYSDSSEDLTFESSRLENLRRDPSVLSLVSIMDSQGYIPSDAFTNSIETPETANKHRMPGYFARFTKSTPELSVRTQPNALLSCPAPQIPNPRINAIPEAPPVRPRSEYLLPSFPRNILSSQTRCTTPESHSFSSLQVEPGSFSLIGDSTKKPALSTHKSLARASDAFRFLEDRYNLHLPPTPTAPSRRGHSANDAVAESLLMSRQIATSRVSGTPFVYEPEVQQTLSPTNATYNLSTRAEPVCFPLAGTSIANVPPGSHISHSRVISPLGSPLPVLTRIQPYSSSFSRSRYGANQTDSTSEETTAPSPSRSLWESSRYSPPSVEMSPRTPKTAELIQGLPEHNGITAPAIVVSPSQTSAYDYYQDKELTSCFPTGRDADFADREVIRTTRTLHRTPGTLDTQAYDCHVPTHSVYMQNSTRKDQHTRVIHMTRSIPTEEGRAGTGISFDFNSNDNIVNADSVGDRLSNDQQEITPGRPTVMLVPSGRQLDRGEGPASASTPASVKPELDREQSGPLFASGLDPHFQQEATSQSAISCTDSFYTAREEFTIGDHAGWTNEFGVRTRFTRNGRPHKIVQTGPPKLNLDLSRSPLVETCGPATSVSSSWSQDPSHHGIQPRRNIGLGMGLGIERQAWLSTSSAESSRDEYSSVLTEAVSRVYCWFTFLLYERVLFVLSSVLSTYVNRS